MITTSAEPAALVAVAGAERPSNTAADASGSAPHDDAEAWQPVRSLLGALDVANRGLTMASTGLAALLGAPRRVLAEALHGEAASCGREARLRAILDTAPEAIVVVDERGAVEAVNPAAEALFGYLAAEIVGQDIGLLMPAPDAGDGALVPHLGAGSQPGTGVAGVTQGRRKDGSAFPLELAVSEVAAEGCAPCFVAFLRDHSDRERMERELRQAQKMGAVGQLTGGVAHDFNNLLTVALGNLEMLEQRLAGEPDLALLREVGDAIHAGAELTSRLLAVARDQPLDPKPLDLQRHVEDLAALLRRTLGAAIEVRTAMTDDLPPALADRGQLQNAVLNLALNARDAMPHGGVLMFKVVAVDPDLAAVASTALQTDGYLLLSVTDTGAGMPPEVLARALEPFFTTKEAGAGTGLGLAMVHNFAKQSGGHVEVHSEPGQGTTVRLYLPQARQPAPAASDSPPAPLEAFPGRGETVLVVEDDAQVRRCAVARLAELGYRVLEAADGLEALRAFEEQGPVALLFTDVVMPGGMTGPDLAVHALRQQPGLRVVLTSGSAAPELVQHGLVEGQWLPKPYTALDLARILRQTLDGAPITPATANLDAGKAPATAASRPGR